MSPPANVTITAATGYEVVTIGAAGELMRWPIIAWSMSTTPGYGADVLTVVIGGCVDGFAFGGRYGLKLPSGEIWQSWSYGPRIFNDAKAWAETCARLDWIETGHVQMGQA